MSTIRRIFQVHCPSCLSEFPIDSSKVPQAGVAAICSTCLRVFPVHHPPDEVETISATAWGVEIADEVALIAGEGASIGEADSEHEVLEESDGSFGEVVPEEEFALDQESDAVAPEETESVAEMDLSNESEPESAFAPELSAEDVVGVEPELGVGDEFAVEPEPSVEDELGFEPEPEIEVEISIESERVVEAEVAFEPEVAIEPEAAFEPEITIDGDFDLEPEAEFVAEVEGSIDEDDGEISEFESPGAAIEAEPAERSAPAVDPPRARTSEFEDLSSFTNEVLAESEPASASPDIERVRPSPEKVERFGRRDPHERARHLARVLVSDIIAYYPVRYQESLARRTLQEDFADEIQKSYREYVDQVGNEMAESTPYFVDALNHVLGRGEKFF